MSFQTFRKPLRSGGLLAIVLLPVIPHAVADEGDPTNTSSIAWATRLGDRLARAYTAGMLDEYL